MGNIKPIDEPLNLALGTIVQHPIRGKGSITDINFDDVLGKFWQIQFVFPFGEMHRYTREKMLKMKLVVGEGEVLPFIDMINFDDDDNDDDDDDDDNDNNNKMMMMID